MNRKFDLVSLIELLDKYKIAKSKQGFLITFTKIIFECVDEDRPADFKIRWKSEIDNGGEITGTYAKTILNRSRKLTSKYREQIIELTIGYENILEGVEEEIIKYVKKDDFDFELREIVNYSFLSKSEKNDLFGDIDNPDIGIFLSNVFLYLVINEEFEYSVTGNVENRKAQKLIFLPFEELKKFDKGKDISELRKTYTLDNLPDHPVFNAITNNPTWGDERNFVRIRDVYSLNYKNELNVEAGKEYEIIIFFHNNAEPKYNTDENQSGIATNVRLSIRQPNSLKANIKTAIGVTISANNSKPLAIWNEAYITSSTEVAVRYVPGSAKIRTNALGNKYLSTKIFDDGGILLGYDNLNGLVPGCTQYVGYVYYRIKIDKPSFEISSKINSKSKNNDEVFVNFEINYKNTGTTMQNKIIVKNTLPEGLEYVENSTKLFNKNLPNGKVLNDELTTKGINIGNYGPNTEAIITFSAKVNSHIIQQQPNEIKNIATITTANGTKKHELSVILI